MTNDSESGAWSDDGFDLTSLLLKQIFEVGGSQIVDFGVSLDLKNTTRTVLVVSAPVHVSRACWECARTCQLCWLHVHPYISVPMFILYISH